MAVHMQSSFILPEKFEKLTSQGFTSVDIGSTPSTPSSPTKDSYDIEIITEKDLPEVLQFLRTFFVKDEPINSSIKLMEGRETCPELEDFSLKNVDDGLSFKAVFNGKLIGICLNGLLERDAKDDYEPSKYSDEKFRKIIKLLDYVSDNSNVFGKFPDVNKAITVKILSVDSAWRGRGVAKALMNKTRELAKEMGCKLMTVDCTSHFTALALKRLGFECIYSLNYEDFTIDGERAFYPEPPHKAVTVYAQRIL